MSYLFPDEIPTKKPKQRKHTGRVTLTILLVLLVLAGGYWLANFLINYRPLISSIPLVQPGGQVTINGARFGTQALGASLVRADGSSKSLQVVSWTPTQIIVKLPAQTSAGPLRSQRRPSWASAPRCRAASSSRRLAALPAQWLRNAGAGRFPMAHLPPGRA